MLGHDDIVLYLHHLVVCADAVQQFMLHHPAYGRQVHVRRALAAVRQAGVARHAPEGAPCVFSRPQCDVIHARQRVVVLLAAACHAVRGGLTGLLGLYGLPRLCRLLGLCHLLMLNKIQRTIALSRVHYIIIYIGAGTQGRAALHLERGGYWPRTTPSNERPVDQLKSTLRPSEICAERRSGTATMALCSEF